MHPLFMVQGVGPSANGTGTPSLGQRQFTLASTAGFLTGQPIFIQDLTTLHAECLGRVVSLGPGSVVVTSWGLLEPPGAGHAWRLVQGIKCITIPPHALPLLHREVVLGVEDLTTEGGEHLYVGPREPVDVVRLRVQRPNAALLDELLDWGHRIATATRPEFTLVEGGRGVVHVAMAQPGIEVRPELCRAGEPFDLMLRRVAENRLAP